MGCATASKVADPPRASEDRIAEAARDLPKEPGDKE
jgi:hypothetical protein